MRFSMDRPHARWLKVVSSIRHRTLAGQIKNVGGGELVGCGIELPTGELNNSLQFMVAYYRTRYCPRANAWWYKSPCVRVQGAEQSSGL